MCLFISTAVKQDKQHHGIQILFLTYLINECATKWMAGQTNEQNLKYELAENTWNHPRLQPTCFWPVFTVEVIYVYQECQSVSPAGLITHRHFSFSIHNQRWKKNPQKKHMPIYFCFTLFNIRDEENVFLCNYLIYLDLEYIKAVGGTVKKKKEGIYRSEKSVLCLKN